MSLSLDELHDVLMGDAHFCPLVEDAVQFIGHFVGNAHNLVGFF